MLRLFSRWSQYCSSQLVVVMDYVSIGRTIRTSPNGKRRGPAEHHRQTNWGAKGRRSYPLALHQSPGCLLHQTRDTRECPDLVNVRFQYLYFVAKVVSRSPVVEKYEPSYFYYVLKEILSQHKRYSEFVKKIYDMADANKLIKKG